MKFYALTLFVLSFAVFSVVYGQTKSLPVEVVKPQPVDDKTEVYQEQLKDFVQIRKNNLKVLQDTTLIIANEKN